MATELVTHTLTYKDAMRWRKDYRTIWYPVKLREFLSQVIHKGYLRIFVTVNKKAITTDAMRVTWPEAVMVFVGEAGKSHERCQAGFRDENQTNDVHSRNNQHNAHICTTTLFYMLAPTCFGSSLSSSGSF
jgi:hypothetical protein